MLHQNMLNAKAGSEGGIDREQTRDPQAAERRAAGTDRMGGSVEMNGPTHSAAREQSGCLRKQQAPGVCPLLTALCLASV